MLSPCSHGEEGLPKEEQQHLNPQQPLPVVGVADHARVGQADEEGKDGVAQERLPKGQGQAEVDGQGGDVEPALTCGVGWMRATWMGAKWMRAKRMRATWLRAKTDEGKNGGGQHG